VTHEDVLRELDRTNSALKALQAKIAPPPVGCENTLMANRLAQETSPYLQQHAENPVEWYPGALKRSRSPRGRTSRSCSRSATRRATGAT
jgi:hypothetical protein